MAEKITLNPAMSSVGEAVPRRLPFAPIFDTIVAEPLPEPPPPSVQPVSAPPKPSPSENRIGSVLFPAPSDQTPAPPQTSTDWHWATAIVLVAMLAVLAYVALQLRNQREVLGSELASSSSRLAAVLADNSKLEQRPWVGIAEVVPLPYASGPGFFNVALQNSGRTPALQTRVSASAQLTDLTGAATGSESVLNVTHTAGTLFPGSQGKVLLDFHLSQPALVALYRGQARLVLHVTVSYDDIFRNSHVTQNCWSWQPALRQMESCNGYDTVN